MTSLARKLNRAAARRYGGKPDAARPQVTQVEETGYRTLHPTLGWRFISNARYWAQQKMAVMLDRFQRPVKQKAFAVLTPPPADTKCRLLSRDVSSADRTAAHKAKMARKYAPAPVVEADAPKKRRTKKAAA